VEKLAERDAPTRLAWQAKDVLIALADRPVTEFTAGELMWLVNLSGQVFLDVEGSLGVAAESLLQKAGLEDGRGDR
jgi:hypothetical protein